MRTSGSVVASLCVRLMHICIRRTKPLPALLYSEATTLKGWGRPTNRAWCTTQNINAMLSAAGDWADGGVRVSKSGLSPDLQWITNPWDRGILFSVKVDAVLYDVRSKFRHVQVLETPAMGRLLVLDSALQCAERDEAGYHEFIAHVALCRRGGKSTGSGSGKPGKRALIIGGGDGGAAREILRHDDVATVDLVDIDVEVMAASKKFIPGVWRHSTSTDEAYVPLDEDERLAVWTEDGLAFLADETREGYDLIVVDASDPVGPGAALYSDEFYDLLRRRLRPRGAVAVQGGSFWYLPLVFRTVHHGLKKAFPMVHALQCFTAVYPGGLRNIQIATLGDDPQEVDLDRAEALCRRVRPRHVVKITNQELLTNLSLTLMLSAPNIQDIPPFLSPQAHHAAFVLPPVVLRDLAKPPPTLRDTIADLEDRMAYGEENNVATRQEELGALSQRWEPDVRRSLSRLVSGASNDAKAPLAAFDADGTLWDGDAAEIFMDWMKTTNRWSHHGDFVQRYYSMLAGGNETEAYGYVAQLFEGMEVTQAQHLTEENFRLNVEHLFVPEMKGIVKDLRARGWRVVIVTASPKWIVEPGALRLGLRRDDVLGIEVYEDQYLWVPVHARTTSSFNKSFETFPVCECKPFNTPTLPVKVETSGGKATSALRFPLPVREGKVHVLRMTFSEEPALAVGNSLDDSAMLSYARDLALVSNPSCSELEALARENGWSVHLLNNSQKRPYGGQVDHRSGTD